MKLFLRQLLKRRFPYDPLITINISKSRILHNLREFQKLAPGVQVAPVLKSNAYGHGLFLIASTIEKNESCPFFCVDSYFEAIALRSQGIKTPILIIAYTRPDTIKTSRLKNTAFAITSLETLQDIADAKKDTHIQLKIDTGMHRQGLYPDELPGAAEIIKKNPRIMLDGIYTHFSSADGNEEYTLRQISLWNKTAAEMRARFPDIKYFHASNTDGFRYAEKIDANVARLGLGLYGIVENDFLNERHEFKPVLEMRTILTSTKKIRKGDAVGYGNTFTAPKDMLIGTVPIGYAEGLDRRLSNMGEILVGPDRAVCPIIGKVSMNMTTVDLSSVKDPKIGMEAVAISDREQDRNSMHGIARICGTTTYEIAGKIPSHLKRTLSD